MQVTQKYVFTTACVVLISLFVSGCSHFGHYPVNDPLKSHNPGYGYTIQNLSDRGNSDKMLLLLSFSGGGTRAAAFSYGVLEALKETVVNFDGKSRRLVDEIDFISAVSGGSFTAAYYGLFGDRIFEDYESHFLKKDVQEDLLISMFFNPINWFRLSSPFFDRSDLAAEYYDKYIFEGKTYGDMLKRKGPAIFINATDMSWGTRIAFHQVFFDAICSDLSTFHLARACAASSAVPGIMTPITLKNYSGSCGYKLSPQVEQFNPHYRQKEMKENVTIVLDRKKKPYFHLIDGGVADNLGLRAIEEAVDSVGNMYTTLKITKQEKNVHKIVFIVVNAEAKLDASWDNYELIPPFAAMLKNYSAISIARYNRETMALLQESFTRWTEDIRTGRCPPGEISTDPDSCGDIKFYLIDVKFSELKDAAEASSLAELPTSFFLRSGDIDRLEKAAGQILNDSSEYQRLLQDLSLPNRSQ